MINTRRYLLIMLLVCAMAMTALAQGPGPRGQRAGSAPGPGPVGPPPCLVRAFLPPSVEAVPTIAAELGLTEAQSAKLKASLETLRDKIRQIAGETQPARDIAAELRANPTDAAKVQRLAAEAMRRESAILQAELDMLMTFEKELNAEQQNKFWDLVLRRPGGMGPGGPPPGPGTPPPPPPSQ